LQKTPPPPSLLVVDDDVEFRDSLISLVEREGFRAEGVGSIAEAQRSLEAGGYDAVLIDRELPDGVGTDLLSEARVASGVEMIVITGHGTVSDAVGALKDGALDYLTKPVDPAKLRTTLANLQRMRKLEREVLTLREELKERGRFGSIVGRSAAMRPVFEMIERVAPTDASVLIQGESGTGKEVVARTLHERSLRSNELLISVNCGAIPEALIESELFGHERGSFTGAQRTHRGFFERANGGTLFLDEVTEMPAQLQVKLLRVLETGDVQRVGGSETIATNVRVLAATNRDPEEAIRTGKLREDLFFRLAVFPIHLPPLRAREGDVELLATHMLEKLNTLHSTAKRWAPGALAELAQREWQGNVRELQNAVQRAYILADDELIAAHASIAPPPPAAAGAAATSITVPVGSSIADAERALIEATLEHVGGNKAAAAKVLGISLKTLYVRLSVYSASEE